MKFNLEKYSPLISSLFTLVIYILTMSRGVMPIDAGELAASQYYFGVSHPSGYPLFNLVGFLWSKIPIGSVIFRLNLLCAIWVALANFFLVKTAFIIIKNSFRLPKQSQKPGSKKQTPVEVKLPSLILQMVASLSGVLMIAFCKTWWIQSAGVEVYSLHIALLSVFFFVFIKTLYKENSTVKDWIITGSFLGLCLANHLTSVLILPGVIILFLWKMKWNKVLVKKGLGLVASSVVITAFFYLLMMVNAGNSPKLNWGNPSNIEYLNRHATGWQFQSFMSDNEQDGPVKNKKEENDAVTDFFNNFQHQTGYIGWLLAGIGIIGMFIKNYKLAVFWMANFIATLIYASKFNIHDIENYFLLAYLSLAIIIAFGLYWALSNIKNIEKNKAFYSLLLLPLLPLMLNYTKADQSKITYIDDYTQAALNSVDKNAIILSEEWDIFVSPAYYYHLVEHQRPDVTVIDKGLLKRSWYHNQIKTWDRDLALRLEKQANEFNAEVIKFERQPRGEKKPQYNGALLQSKYENYITAILNQYQNRPVYVSSYLLDIYISQGIDVKLPPATMLVPETYFFRVVPMDTITYHPLPVPAEFNVHFTDKENDKFQRRILNSGMNVLSLRVQYELGFNKKEEAKKLIELMQTIDSRVTMPAGL
jgi:hypothetical protein